MTDVFISYASEDRETARKLAAGLEKRGWSVWWDRKIIAGQTFDQIIEQELDTAKCVIVLWSQHSITSEWVKGEATVAAEREVLVPAMINNVRLPIEFRRKQTADLTSWDGAYSHEGFLALCDGVSAKLNKGSEGQIPITAPVRQAVRWPRRWILLVITIGIFGLIIFLAWTGLFHKKDNPTGKDNVNQAESLSSPISLSELETQLKAANILISTGNDEEKNKVRSYFTGTTSAYYLLSINCLEVLGKHRLIQTGFLDMIDKWYTLLIGQNNYLTPEGHLNHEKLKEAIVSANNEYYGQHATVFDQVIVAAK
jgi:hypothetical protein